MRRTVAFLFIAAIALASAADFEVEDDVIVLTDDNFDDAIKQHDSLLVEFYAPWCGHCKRLAPEYAKAAGILKQEDPPLYIAKVDATAQEELGERFEIRGFPTLKFFRNGKPAEYEGGRTADDIVAYVKKKSGPPTTAVDSVEAAEKFVKSASVVVLGYFPSKDSDAFKTYEKAATGVDDVLFGSTTSSEVAEKYNVQENGVVLLKDFDEGRATFEGELDDAAIVDFVREEEMPLVIPFGPETARKIFSPDQKVDNQVLLFADQDADYFDGLKKEFENVAKQYKGKSLFVHINADEQRVLNYFDFTEDDLPTLVLVRMSDSGMKKYRFEADKVNEDTVSEFLAAYHDGKLKPFLKSEEVPEENDEPVKVIVGKSFEDVVLQEDKDVMLEFYAPWCGHCKSLAPKYEELAKQFEGVDSVVIAKMDATANEIDYPGVSVQGFPTIYFFPAHGKSSPISYDGARTVEDLAAFIKENAGSSLEGGSSSDSHDEL